MVLVLLMYSKTNPILLTLNDDLATASLQQYTTLNCTILHSLHSDCLDDLELNFRIGDGNTIQHETSI